MSDASKILKDLKNKAYHPVYFLCGVEPFFIDQISDFIEKNVLDESEKAFNQTILYGGETSIDEILETAKRFPMMAEYQVVIVKEAQLLARTLDKLENYLSAPVSSTILVMAYKYKVPDARKKIGKSIKKNTVFLNSKPIYENKVPDFIQERLHELGYKATPEATRLLVDSLGTDLSKISNELKKLAIVHNSSKEITPSSVEKHIGISKDFNNFELRKAIGERDIVKVHRIVNYFGENLKDHPVLLTVAQLFSLFSQLLKIHTLRDQSPQSVAKAVGINPFFTRELIVATKNYPMKYCSRAIKLLRELDVKCKGVGSTNADHAQLLKESIVNIMSK
jgi:DNA polymerase-3 subunit delta